MSDWDDDDFEPPSIVQEAPKKWDDEEEDDDDDGLSFSKSSAPKNAEKQARKNKFKDPKGGAGGAEDETLADPVAEKLRQQRLVEEADYAATKELFGTGGDKNLDDFIPKSGKDFEALGNMVATKYLSPHAASAHFPGLMKALIREAMITLNAAEIKEVESGVIVMRNERMKAEKELAGKGKKAAKKAQLNSGQKTKSKSAGLDDFQYDDVGADDDYDFM